MSLLHVCAIAMGWQPNVAKNEVKFLMCNHIKGVIARTHDNYLCLGYYLLYRVAGGSNAAILVVN